MVGLKTHPTSSNQYAWPHSSIHRDVRRGLVPAAWSGGAEDVVIDPYDRFDAPPRHMVSALA